MASFYSFLQYVPNVLTGDRISIGLVVFGDGAVKVKFVTDWARVEAFGGCDIAFLKDFAERFSEQVAAWTSAGAVNEARIRRMVQWSHTIQLQPPRGSLRGCDELFNALCWAVPLPRTR